MDTHILNFAKTKIGLTFIGSKKQKIIIVLSHTHANKSSKQILYREIRLDLRTVCFNF
jgi:hypothetical protein